MKEIVVVNPFTKRRDGYVQPVIEYDQYYVNRKIVQVVKKTGEGDSDFVLEDKVVDELVPIQDVIDADAGSVGVYNIIQQVLKTGDESILNIDNSGSNCDITHIPETLADAKKMLDDAADAYDKRPSILKDKSLQDLSTMSDTAIKDLINTAVLEAIAKAKSTEIKKGE